MNLIKTSGLALAIVAGLGLQACSSTSITTNNNAAMSTVNNPLSLAQIYKDKEFKTQRSTYFKWLDDGTGYTVLEERESEKEKEKADDNNADDEKEHGVKGNDIVFYNADGTGRRVLVEFEKLLPEGADEPFAIVMVN